ncbi:MAG: DUF839 domain-containing protein [Candidatus Sericytochromatia bacterium]|nr:DUF839 domain-containing protein [Candidatus Sericytochromatia bacterium]
MRMWQYWLTGGTVALMLSAAAIPLPVALATPLTPELQVKVLIRAGDRLSDGTDFAQQNDFTAYLPEDAGHGTLMVGHELSHRNDPVGGRFTKLGLTGLTVTSSAFWVGDMHNLCAGAVTPWGTILSCEEFPASALPGSRIFNDLAYLTLRVQPTDPVARYGYVYEIDPKATDPARRAVRRPALGRFSHESACMVGDRDVYLTEDFEDGYLFRFRMDRAGDLTHGRLFAYDRPNARWLPITDPLNAHLDAAAVKATPFHRLEDVTLAPDGTLFIAETGQPKAGDPFGRVLRLDPKTMRMAVYLNGDGTTLANPDNLIVDRKGRLLICEDRYDEFLPLTGANRVLAVSPDRRVTPILRILAVGEPTGPSFSPDGTTLFLSVMAKALGGVVAVTGF